MRYWVRVVFAALLPVWAWGAGAVTPPSLPAYKAAKQALAPHFDGFSLDDHPASEALFERQWLALEVLATEVLTRQPDMGDAALATALKGLDKELEVSALALDAKTRVLAVSQGEMGRVFVLTFQGGAYRVAWRITQARTAGPFVRLAGWSAAGAKRSCTNPRADFKGERCGPLFGVVGRLPDSPTGEKRFFVDARYAQGAGMTMGAQLSVWAWCGGAAYPMFTKDYALMIDDEQPPRLEGSILHIHVKDEFKMFFACGSCAGRKMDWRVRIDPQGVTDLGRQSQVPALDVIDVLYALRNRHRSIAHLAAPAVRRVIDDSLADVRAAYKGEGEVSLGMLDTEVSTHDGRYTRLCFSTDRAGPFRFTLEDRGGKPYVSGVKAGPDSSCKQ